MDSRDSLKSNWNVLHIQILPLQKKAFVYHLNKMAGFCLKNNSLMKMAIYTRRINPLQALVHIHPRLTEHISGMKDTKTEVVRLKITVPGVVRNVELYLLVI